MTTSTPSRIDHMAALVAPERLPATIAQLSFACQTAFYGPYDRTDLGARIATSWDAGITLVSPVDGGAGHVAAALDERGEGWWTLAYGVRDLAHTVTRQAELGFGAARIIDGLTGVEPWYDRFRRLDEASYPPAVQGGLPITLCTIEEHTTAPPRGRAVNRIHHVTALVRPEDLDATVRRLSFTLQTSFYGPHEDTDLGTRTAVSWDAGVALVAPLPGVRGPAATALDQRGPGWWRVAYGVRDLDGTRARLAALGHESTGTVHGPTGDEPWYDRFSRVDEAHYDPALFAGLPVVYCQIEEHPE